MTLLQIAPPPVPVPPSERAPEALVLAVIGVAILSLVALLAAGMTFLGRYRRADAAALQARIAEAVAGDVDCARVDVVTAGPSILLPVSVTLEGVVPSGAVRVRARRRAQAAARQAGSQVTVIDRLVVETDRAA